MNPTPSILSPDFLWGMILVAFILVMYNIDAIYEISGNNIQLFNVMQYIDRQCNRAIPASRLGITDVGLWIILSYFIYIVNSGSMQVFYKILVTLLLITIPIICIFPAIHLYNQIIYIFCSNPPMNLDKNLYFPGHKAFENTNIFKNIQSEVVKLLDKNELKCFNKTHATDLDNNTKDKCWKWFPILDQFGWHDKNASQIPEITKLIKADKQIASAAISIIEPGMGIPEHRGYLQSVLRYHLGIIIPTDDSPYRVCGGETYYWKEGEGVIFDDMYLHHVMNPSKYRRAVLFIDVLRNDLPYPIDKFAYKVHDYLENIRSLKIFDNRSHQHQKITSNVDANGIMSHIL